MDVQEKSNKILEVNDETSEVKQKKEESMQNKIQMRKKSLIDLIIRQTNYDQDKAMAKLIEWNYNYLNVIKEYMNPDFQIKKKPKEKETKNQMIYGQIRHFMDDVNKQALWRKRQKIKIEKQRNAYIQYLKNLQDKPK